MEKCLLLIEDSKIDAFRIKQALSDGEYKNYIVKHFTTLTEGLQWLEENICTLVLLDLGLPDSDDVNTYNTFAAKHPFLPVVILSSTSNYSIGIDAIRNGAQDFVEKERLEPILLERAIHKALERNLLISEIEQAKAEAQKNSASLRAVIDNSPNTIWMVDAQLRLIACNKKFVRTITKKSGRIPHKGDNVADIIHPKTFDSWSFLYNRALQGEQFTEIKKYNIDGREYFAEFTFNPVKTPTGVAAISISARDITNKRRMMSLLEAEKQVLAEQALGQSFSESFTNLIKKIELLGQGMLCSVMVCPQPDNVLTYLAAPSLPKSFVNSTDGICSIPPKINTPIILNGPSSTTLDKLFTAGWESMRAEAKKIGIDTIYSFPILSSKNRPLGCFLAYYKAGLKPTQIDFEIIERVKLLAAAIIEKHISDENLVASEKRFRALIEKSAELIFLIDEEGRINYASPSVTKSLGYKPSELVKEQLLNLVNVQDFDEVNRKFTKLLKRTEGNGTIDFKLNSKKGDWRRFEGKVTNLLSDPVVGAIVLNLSDVTEEYSARQELHLRDRALEASVSGKLIIDTTQENTPIIYANQAFYEITGFSEDEVLYNNFDFLFGEETDKLTVATLNTSLKAGEVFQGEVLNYRNDGSTFWNYLTMLPVLDERGKLMYYVANINDISALKDTELQLRQKNDELNTFVYKATHDLKGPLASILGLTQLAVDEVKDEAGKRYIAYIRESTGRLDMILNDLLRISKVTHVTPSYKKIDLNKVVQHIADNIKKSPYSDNVDIMTRINITEDLVTDETLLVSAIQNLLDNAVKYKNTRAVKPYAMIEAHNYKDGVMISVSDNGCGTPKEIQGKIFDMFFRGNERSTGSGLGLYMVKKAVEKLHGDINFTSEAGVGSVFTLYLPNVSQNA